MKLKIAEKIIYRVPQFPIDAKLEDCWDELKQSIALSSTDFFKEIENLNYANWKDIPTKYRLTILKYFNRAKYRSIPFGTFAAVGLINPQPDERSTAIVLENKQEAKSFIDWPYKDKLSYELQDLIREDCYLFTNSTYYLTPESIRYVFKSDATFELDDLEPDHNLLLILEFCRQQVRLSTIVNHFVEKFPSPESLHSLIAEIVSAQLLFTSLDPNIIGGDYFTRINVNPKADIPSYVITERKYVNGNLDRKLLQHIPALIKLLHGLTTTTGTSPNLKSFKEKFLKRFDQAEMPIMQVLDPELGLGYGNLEHSGIVPPHINDLLTLQPPNQNQELIRNSLLNTRSHFPKGVLYLDKLINPEDYPKPDQSLPNSISALVKIVDEYVCIDQLGGYSSNQYAGRFSLASDEIHQFCKEIALAEQSANPDVLLFDIGYLAEMKVDNVNRRRQIYEHQLTLLNYDTSIGPLTLDDIMISVRNNEVILRSKQLNKRLVPRLATAYNHSRSDLPVYRFLCDLITQQLNTRLSFDLQELRPGLPYYPRIQFQNIIVSPVKWKLSNDDFKNYVTAEKNKMQSYITSLGITGLIKTGFADQTLIIDTENPDDLVILNAQLSGKDNLYVEEALLPKESVIKDKDGKPFLGQFLLSILHDEKIYDGIPLKEPNSHFCQRTFVPGTEWLYFEIYCHPQRADQLLSHKINSFLKSHEGQLKKWFFIRYNENGDHLRLRLHLQEPTYAGFLMKAFGEMINEEIQFGAVSDVQVKTYTREVERYGMDLIKHVEEYFAEDSRFILELLKGDLDDQLKYKICLGLFDHIRKTGLFSEVELLNKYIEIYKGFTMEHQLGTAEFKKLNSFVRQFGSFKELPLSDHTAQLYGNLCDSLEHLIGICPEAGRFKLLTDVMHMHVNRMFASHQRSHEMVIYEILLSTLKRERALSSRSIANSLN
jgi:thiopeptide-type bacteriocin biosynthesis protein